MKREKYPGTNEYVFELTLGINSVLGLTGGELSTLVVDGLFVLDDQGMLFPGVTDPEDCLRMASMVEIGYARSDGAAVVGDAYNRAIANLRPPTREGRELRDRLNDAIDILGATTLRQRMLIAKLNGFSDKCLYGEALTEADLANAEALISAADAIIAAVETSTKRVL